MANDVKEELDDEYDITPIKDDDCYSEDDSPLDVIGVSMKMKQLKVIYNTVDKVYVMNEIYKMIKDNGILKYK